MRAHVTVIERIAKPRLKIPLENRVMRRRSIRSSRGLTLLYFETIETVTGKLK
jgi:hypothetical protein